MSAPKHTSSCNWRALERRRKRQILAGLPAGRLNGRPSLSPNARPSLSPDGRHSLGSIGRASPARFGPPEGHFWAPSGPQRGAKSQVSDTLGPVGDKLQQKWKLFWGHEQLGQAEERRN